MPSRDAATKRPCLYPLPDGRRCCECDTCQGHDAAKEPTKEQVVAALNSLKIRAWWWDKWTKR